LARRIPQELIDDIRSANDIVDVICERIQIKKAGSNYKANCPFHREKTPSFNVSPERQIYHCFGCGAGGNVITFLMEYEKIGFLDAIRELASRAGIRIPETARFRDETEDPAFATNAFAVAHFRRRLASSAGSEARAYARDRGLTDESLEAFQIGYAPPGWDGLLQAARKEGLSQTALEEAGLVIRRDDGGAYDRFRDRLIFPLLVSGGRCVGLAGRSLGDQEPKYLNSPETRVYKKSTYLYGLSQARHALRSSREAILVEGYMDVIGLNQAGFVNAVASSGTALTREQARALRRYADKVFVAFDGDDAGIGAATRAAETLVRLGLKVRVALLPDSSDPDAFVRAHGAEALRAELVSSRDFIDFYAVTNPVGTPDEREEAARALIDAVAHVEDPITADLMLEKIATTLSIGRGAITRALEARTAELAGRRRAADAAEEPRGEAGGEAGERAISGATRAAERGLLALLLAGGEGAARVTSLVTTDDFADPGLRAIAGRILPGLSDGGPVDVSALVGELGDAGQGALLTELTLASGEGRDGERLSGDYIRTIRRAKIETEIKAVERRIRTAEMTDDEDELLAQVARRHELARRLRELSVEL